MGRPKGSRNKVRDMDISPVPYVGYDQAAPVTIAEADAVNEMAAGPLRKSDPLTVHLTDEDLAPIRDAKARHERAAAKYRKNEIASELRRKEIGEIEELSVPQVVAFDLPAAMRNAAAQKARESGYRFAHNLRKTPEGWVFEGSNRPKEVVKHDDAPADQL